MEAFGESLIDLSSSQLNKNLIFELGRKAIFTTLN